MSEPRVVVIDASVALSIVRREPDGPAAAQVISALTRSGARLVVPAHFWLEITNSLLRRHRWNGKRVLQAIHDLDTIGFETIPLDRPLIVLAIDMAERHGLTAYDSAYMALAASLDAAVATHDPALRAAAGNRAVHIGPTRVSEMPAPYEHSVTWPDYKGASAFLAKLRAEAARPA